MIQITPQMRILVAVESVDFRKVVATRHAKASASSRKMAQTSPPKCSRQAPAAPSSRLRLPNRLHSLRPNPRPNCPDKSATPRPESCSMLAASGRFRPYLSNLARVLNLAARMSE